MPTVHSLLHQPPLPATARHCRFGNPSDQSKRYRRLPCPSPEAVPSQVTPLSVALAARPLAALWSTERGAGNGEGGRGRLQRQARLAAKRQRLVISH